MSDSCDPMDYSPPGSPVHGISQARTLEQIAISFSRGSSWPRDQTWVSCTAGGFFMDWATWEAIEGRVSTWIIWNSSVKDISFFHLFIHSVTSEYWEIQRYLFYTLSCVCVCLVASVVSDSLQPHGLQPARLLRPWDFPGKETGVACHFLHNKNEKVPI